MAKVQQISEITPSFAFTEFDLYKDYEESFKKCENRRSLTISSFLVPRSSRSEKQIKQLLPQHSPSLANARFLEYEHTIYYQSNAWSDEEVGGTTQ